MVDLSKLMSGFNLPIFELLIDGSFSVRDLAKEIKCSPAKITQFLKLFQKNKLINLISDKNRKVIELNKAHPVVREIVSLIFVNKILGSKSFLQLKKKAIAVGVYGSVVEGTLDKHSDIDLWVVAEKKNRFFGSAEIRMQMSEELGREVSLKFFTPDSVNDLKKKDRIFYNELEYKSNVLFGEAFG